MYRSADIHSRPSGSHATVDQVAELPMETVSRAHAVYADAYEAADLTERQWLLLRRLQREDQAPFVGQLADWLQTEPPTATAMADRLQARGLIERRADGGDARRRTVHLTTAGEATLETIEAAALKRTPCRHLTQRQLDQLHSLLHTMLDDDVPEASSPSPHSNDREP